MDPPLQGHAPPRAAGDAAAGAPAGCDGTGGARPMLLLPPSVNVPQELPFLVTNWLANYRPSANEDGAARAAALAQVRRAAAELAAAFSSLGAFGETVRPSFSSESDFASDAPVRHPVTFADARRQWSSSCPVNQLESLVQAAASGSAAVEQSLGGPVLLLAAAQEGVRNHKLHPDSGGRTMLEARTADKGEDQMERPVASALQKTVIVRIADDDTMGGGGKQGSDLSTKPVVMTSDIAETSREVARLVRHFLNTRDSFRKNEAHIRSLRKSLVLHRNLLAALAVRRGSALQLSSDTDLDTKMKLLDEIKESEDNSSRVVQQLERQLGLLELMHASESRAVANAEAAARDAFAVLQRSVMGFRDPAKKKLNNTILLNLTARQVGLERRGNMLSPRSEGRMRQDAAAFQNQLAIIKNRMSHAVTINTHLTYPVFCLRFDRSGRYFITGADDYLAKVFCLGANVRPFGKSVDPASLYRGAVLVCTLRGHAGVINDIDVSSDNCFLATASEDGDCRIWGLKDGCPVAVLRGHKDGCNMVSWSTLTPYHLVTAASDGYARCWDIREACLKRYRRYAGKRPEYRLDLIYSSPIPTASAGSERADGQSQVAPPSPSMRGRDVPIESANQTEGSSVPVPLLPLPPGVNAAPIQAIDLVNDVEESGQFVANDTIDEGVQLLEKLQHCHSMDEQRNGPGTRARRTSVKVICIARCPHGGHFATGSDDGICRLWRSMDDRRVRVADSKVSETSTNNARAHFLQIPDASSNSNRHLFDLQGHVKAITDLRYSAKGDRLLSASQKEGVVCIWSWNVDPAVTQSEAISFTRIVIKLTNPGSVSDSSSHDGSHQRAVKISTSKVSCDVAVWSYDDSKIITSQCEPIKENSSTIAPGSQYFFLWDSNTGDCLLGIRGAHSMQCPVIIPHPQDASIFCSAGSDGLLKLWDAEAGSTFFMHKNTVDHGPVEAHERGKISGYLDGSFSPDGMSLVVADDSGRLSVFDCAVSRSINTESVAPAWMKEQYFRNDYYDLLYDSHGYCIERGSEQPPHLAPKGVRCSHGGIAWSDSINDGFRYLIGPIPTEEREARRLRHQILLSADSVSRCRYPVRGNIFNQHNPKTTLMLHCDASGTVSFGKAAENVQERRGATREQPTERNVHRLSSNWRWGDAFNEMQDDGNDDEEVDPDDEDFEIPTHQRSSRRLRHSSDTEDTDDEDLDDEVFSSESPGRRRSGRQIRNDEDESDIEDIVEYMSTNNTPSGPFVRDYETHFFKMGNERDAASLSRAWLRRVESDSSYAGKKIYVPQLDDAVVYIPRAHQETIHSYPGLAAPWHSMPEGAVWPVVRCCIRHVRYRFPFKSYFKRGENRCSSVVVILTLEITGIPEGAQESPLIMTFAQPTSQYFFEVCLFENDQPEYIIPFNLYTARIRMVDHAIRHLDETPYPPIEALYADTSTTDDCEFVPWQGRIEGVLDEDTIEPDLRGSGFDSIEVSWGRRGSDRNRVSPWDISLVCSAPPITSNRPMLTEEERHKVQAALAEIKSLKTTSDEEVVYGVDYIFGSPVDETQYSDYSSRVEVPMDLSFVSERLSGGYYATILSVVSDVRLIRENCAKYNGDQDPMTLLANEMVMRFEELVLSEQQRDAWKEIDAIASSSALTAGESSNAASSELRSRPSRARRTASSILEDVYFSSNMSGSRENRRQRSPVNARSPGRRSSRQRISGLSGLAFSRRGQNSDSLLHSGHGRGRNNIGGTRATSRTRSLRHTSRPDYNETPSDVDETEEHNATPVPSERNRSGRNHLPRQSERSLRRQTRQNEHNDSDINQEREQLTLRVRPTRTGGTGGENLTSRRRQGTLRRVTSDNNESSRHDHANRLAGASNSSRRNEGGTSTIDRRRRTPQESIANDRTQEMAEDSDQHTDDDVNESESDSLLNRNHHSTRATRASIRRSARASRSYTAETDSDSHMSDQDDKQDDTSDEKPSTRKARRATERESIPVRQSKAPRKSTRKAPAADKEDYSSHGDDDNDDDDDDATDLELDPDSSDEEVPIRSNNSRSSSQRSRRDTSGLNSAVRSGNRRHPSQKSYADPSSSEEDHDEITNFKSTPTLKRPKGTDDTQLFSKKRKTDSVSMSPRIPFKSWKFVEPKEIITVGNALLDRLGQEDDAGVFAEPVLEAYPEVAEEYLNIVQQPMDFRSIREERLARYKSADELREDLMLVFNNCVAFNDEDSEFAALAISMIQNLDAAFKAVCEEKNIHLPRRW